MLSSAVARCSVLYLLLIVFGSCKTSGPGIFGKKSPHEYYADRLTKAGLNSTALGNLWFQSAEQSISSPLTIRIPYKETGYFSAERPSAAGFRFDAKRGQKLTVSVQRNPSSNFTLYIDLWTAAENQRKHIAAADTLRYSIQHEVNEDASFILRIQPELLSSGEYTLSITAGPSLAYPIKAPGKNHIKSFWGAERDGGIRKHEGIDLFAAFGSPVVAAANGRVTRVGETAIGGKVVWLQPDNKNYTLYYAHLDTQLVREGDKVVAGDTLGLMGNTGNARSTSPHLHFGIYTFGGAVDPFPFVNPEDTLSENIISPTGLIGKLARNGSANAALYIQPYTNAAQLTQIPGNTILRIEAATASWFKVSLPDSRQGYIKNAAVTTAEKPVQKLTAKAFLPVRDRPDSSAAKKTSIPPGETVDILGRFDDYYLIATDNEVTGWIRNPDLTR